MKINLLNYETYAIDYLENKLDPEMHQVMQEFLIAHPSIKQELEELASFDLPVFSSISYPHKDRLYWKSKKLYLPVLAIAASLLLFLTFGYYFLYNDNALDNQEVQTPFVENPVNQNVDPLIKSDHHFVETKISETPKTEQASGKTNISKPEMIQKEAALDFLDPPKAVLANNTPKLGTENVKADEEIDPDIPSRIVVQELIITKKAIAQIPTIILKPASVKPHVETADLVIYELSDLSISSKVAEVKKAKIFTGLVQPESFEKEDFTSLKKAIVPEAFGNLFSKKTR